MRVTRKGGPLTGTSSGGKKAALKNVHRYGDDYYSRIGKIGGQKGRGHSYGGGFAYVEPGQTESNGKKFGAIGGYLSKRSRKIEVGDKLRNDEINELLKLGIRALGTLRINGLIDVVTEHMCHATLYSEVGEGNWPFAFTDCGVGPRIKVIWAGLLSSEVEDYQRLARKRYDLGEKPLLSEEESNRYRIIRNLVRAFESATGTDIQ